MQAAGLRCSRTVWHSCVLALRSQRLSVCCLGQCCRLSACATDTPHGLQTKHILLAVGGRATKIPIPGAEHAITSDEILNLPEVPKRLACIGGGYISLEFASIYNHYGSEVHVVYRQVRKNVSRMCRDA